MAIQVSTRNRSNRASLKGRVYKSTYNKGQTATSFFDR